MFQQYPHVSGLKTLLQENLSFQVHTREFVQIICVRNSHWVTVSSVGCVEGQVNIYDSMYSSSLACCLLLAIRIMDVGRQPNRSNCGVLAIAIGYDICSGTDPCKHTYTRDKVIGFVCHRQHEKCQISSFVVEKLVPIHFESLGPAHEHQR